MPSETYSFHQFKALSDYRQLKFINENGIRLKLGYVTKNTEAELFCYADYYIEVIVERYTKEVLQIKPFKGLKKLNPYLSQIDIDEITILLCYS